MYRSSPTRASFEDPDFTRKWRMVGFSPQGRDVLYL
jgi:hypothetical protein